MQLTIRKNTGSLASSSDTKYHIMVEGRQCGEITYDCENYYMVHLFIHNANRNPFASRWTRVTLTSDGRYYGFSSEDDATNALRTRWQNIQSQYRLYLLGS